ncbi:Gfo/Idh/MocA family protein [Lederbergia citri]|uniref:Gfo/Idh/MocA family oxidoreductase n=1 Tax=Lederbergia citri TaxID=2833580 RepID=A0A942TDB2_9BACI|nr:Gfo/Idh/MocA family oxidoreductase [Lederbergia citri]MBS4195735.1 Gfo/Idh/MocA family oxidoreductase [Lederbergia citri]
MIKFAIVGMGHIANKHIQAIDQIDNAQVAAVCDTNIDRLKEFEGKYPIYKDLEDMLQKQTDIDVVNICVPSGLHAPLAKIVASYGKHIILEKPMALNCDDSMEIIDAAKRANVKLSIVHPNRFRPVIQLLQETMSKGMLGKLSHANITVRWNRGQEYYDQAAWRGTKQYDGGVLMNQAIHNIDLLLWLMGPVKSVQAMSATRLRNIETEDVALGVVEFESGALGVIEAATTIYKENLEESIAIFGEKGSVKISGKNANYIETWNIEGISDEKRDEYIDRIKEDPFGKPGHQCIIEDMVTAIKEDRQPVVSGNDGLAPIQLIEAMLKSSETGERIILGKEKEI